MPPPRGRPAQSPSPGSAPDDEAFWQRQGKRRFGSLAQPCCSLSGICHLLGRLHGNLAVIIHGDQDCGNSFIHHWMPGADNFYCTHLSEAQTLTGGVDEPLAEVLRLAVAERQPEAVFVLTTCLIQLIGSDPEPVVARFAETTGTPVLLLKTGGLQIGTQAAMADWLYSRLAALPPHPASGAKRGAHRRCNLIGLPASGIEESELREVLAAGEIEVNGSFPSTVHLDDWRRIAQADLNVVADRRLYPRLLEQLEQVRRVPLIEVPLPIGLDQTARFYRAIGEHFNVGARLEKALRRMRAALAPAQEAFRERARGRRVALGLRMHNDFRAEMLAYGGLPEAIALGEMGFEVTLIIQGPVEDQARFEELLRGYGCPLAHVVVPHPWHLAGLLKAGGFDVAIMPEHCLEEARKAGLPLMVSRELAPMLAGVPHNLALLEEILIPSGARTGAAAP